MSGNRHRRAEMKRARRAKRTAASRGGGRGPVTRGAARAGLMNEGERRIGVMVRSTRPARAARKTKRKGTLIPRWGRTSYGTVARTDLIGALEKRHAEAAR